MQLKIFPHVKDVLALDKCRRFSMLNRILTALVGLPFIIFLIHIGKWPLQLAVFICSMIGLSEIYHALSKKNYALHILGYLLSGAYMLILNDFSFNKFVIIFSAFIISLMISLIFSNSDIIDCLITFWILLRNIFNVVHHSCS